MAVNPYELEMALDELKRLDSLGDTAAAAAQAEKVRALQTKVAEENQMISSAKNESRLRDVSQSPGAYGIVGGTAGLLAGKALPAAVDAMTPAPYKAVQPNAAPAPVPMPAPVAAPAPVPTQGGFHSGAVSNAQFNAQQIQANQLHKPGNIPAGFQVTDNSRIITPTTLNTPVAPTAAPVVPPAVQQPKLSMPAVKATLQNTAKGFENQPPAPPVGRYGRFYGAGMATGLAKDAEEQLRQGNVGQAAISGVGSVGALASLSSNPKLRALGRGVSVAAPVLRTMTAPKEYAAGSKVIKGGLEAVKKLVSPAHAIGEQKPVKMSDWAQNYMNQYIVPIQADRMGGVGGPSYSANQLLHPQYKGVAWGSGQPGTATMIANLAKDPRFGGVENQIFTPSIGDVHMHKSNQIVHDMLANEFYKNIDKLTPELESTINNYMRLGGPKKTGKLSFDPMEDFNIRDRDQLAELAKTFEKRKLISQHAFGGENIGGRKAQIIPYEEILHDTSDPFTHGADTFSLGPRAFRLSGEVNPTARPDLNVAYPYQLHGEDLNITYQNTPSGLALLDFQNQWRKDTGNTKPLKSGKLPEPGYYEHTLGYTPSGSSERVYPRQKATEDWIKELWRNGMAEGGSTTPAWQRKEGKNPEGGLNAAGRASYNRETGGNLKAPQPEGGPRRDSFCARMEGMKKKLTSAKTANDPDSRINKSLRKWKC